MMRVKAFAEVSEVMENSLQGTALRRFAEVEKTRAEVLME
jgi:hypothetical protein